MASATRSRDQRQWVTLGGRWPAPGCGDSGHCITLGPAEAETLSGDTGARVGTMEPLTQDEQDLPFSSPSPSPVISQHSELCGKLSQFSLALASDYDGAKVRGRAEIIRWRRPDSKLKPLTV